MLGRSSPSPSWGRMCSGSPSSVWCFQLGWSQRFRLGIQQPSTWMPGRRWIDSSVVMIMAALTVAGAAVAIMQWLLNMFAPPMALADFEGAMVRHEKAVQKAIQDSA